MILGIDVGNTHVVIGSIEGDAVKSLARIATDKNKTEFEYAGILANANRFYGDPEDPVEGVVISSVVPAVTASLKGAVHMLYGFEPLVVGAGIKTGLNIRIDDPAQLGSDLVVGSVGALALCPPPIIVIDLGTATTVCAVDKTGSFCGGAIVPGVRLSMNALSGTASLLPQINVEAPARCIGTNTVACMQSGAVFGTAAMLDGLIDRMEEELGSKASLIATGGLATSVVPHCRHKIQVEPDLLLLGLAKIWQKNNR